MEESQFALRQSIQETERLMEESDTMLRRHREEHEAGDAGGTSATKIQNLAELKEQAARYRNLARSTLDLKAKCVLLEMAAECEARALRL